MTRNAIILCAGLGKRMRPLTNTLPKPLITVAGKTMLDRAFDHLQTTDISHIIVNTHYLSSQIEDYVKDRALISYEEDLLETGGGIQKALSLLGNEAFFALNGDCVWTDSESLSLLDQAWDDNKMDALLLLIPREKACEFEGDFFLSQEGRLARRGEALSAPYVYTGVQILSPRLFVNEKEGSYSINVLYNKALEKGRLFGHIHEGEWFHIGTPEDLIKYEPIVAEIESSIEGMGSQIVNG